MTNGNSEGHAGNQGQDGAAAIAEALGRLVDEVKKDNQRDRKLVYTIVAMLGIGVVAAGVNVGGLVVSMSDDMHDMNLSMQTMQSDMTEMLARIDTMSRVMATMDTMGSDMHEMTAKVDAMSTDVGRMSAAVAHMTQSVGLMSTMTPAVQKMSYDTGSMGRDMHWMMPFNWMPGH